MCWGVDVFITGCPEIQSLVVRVEGRAVEPQVVMRSCLIVAQAAHGFLLSRDQVLTASLRWVVAAAEVAEVGRFGQGQQDISLLKLLLRYNVGDNAAPSKSALQYQV